MNHAAVTITGYAREELLSKTFQDLIHPGYPEVISRRPGAGRGSAEQREVKIRTKDGDERWLDIHR